MLIRSRTVEANSENISSQRHQIPELNSLTLQTRSITEDIDECEILQGNIHSLIKELHVTLNTKKEEYIICIMNNTDLSILDTKLEIHDYHTPK